MIRPAALWLALGWFAYAFLPWYGLEGGGFFSLAWLVDYPAATTAGGLMQSLAFDRWWLLPVAIGLLVPLPALAMPRDDPRVSRLLVLGGLSGLALMTLEGFAIDHRGWAYEWLTALASRLL